MRTETGRLLDGIEHNGVTHYDFEVRLPLVRDTGQALDDTDDRFGTISGNRADAFYRCALYAVTLVRVGDIPPSELTPDLLYDALTEDDYDEIKNALERLRAKRSGGNPGSPDCASPPSPSDSTVSDPSQ